MLIEGPKYWNDVWKQEQKTEHYPKGELIKWAQFYLKSFKGKKTLEIGCGSGAFSAEIAKKGAQAYAIDFSREAVDLSKFTASKNGASVQLIQANGLNLPFSNSTFDLVFSEGLLEHVAVEEKEKILKEQARVVKLKGIVIVDIPFQYEIRKPCKEALDCFEQTDGMKLRRNYLWRKLTLIIRRETSVVKRV